MRVEKKLRNLYGRFFFRFPDGESAADVYDRITGTYIDTYLYTHTYILSLFIKCQKFWFSESKDLPFYNTMKCASNAGFRETLRSDIDIGRFQPPGDRNPGINLVIVSHGLTLRVFLMRWYKWTVEQFHGLNNFGNGKMIVMEKGYGGRYILTITANLQ